MTATTATEQYVRVAITEPEIASVTVVEQQNQVTVTDDEPNVVYVSVNGSQGPRGPGILANDGQPSASDGEIGDIYIDTLTGAMWGPKTEAGWGANPFFQTGASQRHIHTQASPSSSWTITHALGGYPSITVVDSASSVVIGEVSYLSTSQVRVVFSSPFSGFAYLT